MLRHGGGGDTDGPDGGLDERPESRQQRQLILLLVAIGVAAALALAALFYLGTRLGLTEESPAVAPTAPATSIAPTATPSPSPTVPPAPPEGPVPPGEHRWNELGGGECLDPFAGAWAEEFTVVDCALPHRAQLVTRSGYPTDAAEYPGAETIAEQLSLLCGSPTVIDMTVAAQYTDLQIDGAYPVTAEQWDAGERDYFCFVSRASGELLSGSITPAV